MNTLSNNKTLEEMSLGPGMYRLNDSKLRNIGWEPEADFDDEIGEIVEFYRNNFIW